MKISKALVLNGFGRKIKAAQYHALIEEPLLRWKSSGGHIGVTEPKNHKKSTREIPPKCLILLVGTRGFEPRAP